MLAFAVRRCRVWQHNKGVLNPPKGAELQHLNLFTEAVNRTKALLQDPEQLSAWQKRFNKQLPNTRGKRPDPHVPIDPKIKRPKRYIQLPAFIKGIIFHQLKAENQTQNTTEAAQN